MYIVFFSLFTDGYTDSKKTDVVISANYYEFGELSSKYTRVFVFVETGAVYIYIYEYYIHTVLLRRNDP